MINECFFLGRLSSVNALHISVDERYLSLTWSAPFSLAMDIVYIVRVENLTSLISTMDVVETIQYYLESASSRPIACDDFNFTVIPENLVGLGEPNSIALISERKFFLFFFGV